MKIRYFDHSATTATDEKVLEAMLPYFRNNYGNPSSVYSIGKFNKEAINIARMKVASALNAKVNEIYFTSGGTESDNLIIKGIAFANRHKGNHIITSKIEHPAVLNTCKYLENFGFRITYLDVDSNGIIDLKQLERSINRNTILVSIMFANNEIGTIEPVKEIGKICRKYGVFFHTDAVQAIGNIKIDVKGLGISALSMSAHKFYGPKGIGALYLNKKIKVLSYLHGGAQEFSKRAGTENVAGIVGMAKALELAYNNLEKNNLYVKDLRDKIIDGVLNNISHVKLNGDREKRLANNINFSFEFIEGESLLLMLDAKNIFASSGSACTSGSLDPSHVLLAIGLPHELAHGSLRITLGKHNTQKETDYFLNVLPDIVKKLRDMSPLYEEYLSKK